MRRRRALATLAALALVAGAVNPLLAGADPVEAAWSGTQVATGQLTAGTVQPATALTCTAGLLTPVTFQWTAPSGGLTRSGYRWTLTGSLNGSGTLASTATSVTMGGGLLAVGSGTFQLFAVGPGGWESVPVSGSMSALNVVLGLTTSCSVP